MAIENAPLLSAATAPQTSTKPAALAKGLRTFQVAGKTTAGAGAVNVDILAGNTDDVNEAVLLGSVDLTLGTTPKGEGFVSDAPWRLVWARINTISGTGATVNVVAAA